MLRSIKDLEFVHAMGKVSDKDFAEMGARLRARAAGLIRQLDSGTNYRQAIQAEIDKRVGGGPNMARPPVGPPPVTGGRALSEGGRTLSGPPEQKAATKLCLSCCTPNDPDARFCKGCGYQLGNW